MSLIELMLLKMPTGALGAVIVVGAVTISVCGLLIARRFIGVRRLKIHHDVAGPVYHTLGVIYAVALGFMVIIAWENFDRIDSNVSREANCYADLARDANGLSEPFSSEAKTAIGEYVKALVEEEWPMLAWGGRSTHVHDLFTEIWDLYLSYEPKTERENVFFAASIQKLNDAGELRAQRIMDSRSGIHTLLWSVLLAGGFIVIIFCYFFGPEKLRAQIIMTALLSALISLSLFTIIVLDSPFAGDMRITPDAFLPILMYLG